MTEPDPPHAADTEPESLPAPEDTPPPPRAKRDALPWLCGVGFLLLAGAIAAVWQSRPPAAASDAAPAALANQVQALETRVAQLEQIPGAPAAADTAALIARVTALEHRQGGNVAPLEARVAALEQKIGIDNQLAARMDALSGRLDALSGSDRSNDAQTGQKLDADEARLGKLEHDVAQVSVEAQLVARLARIQAAQAALADGEKLGDIPRAPAAVSHFATTAPPTEAALRLAFPKAEHAALEASRPDADGKPFLARVLARAEDLVTVRQGDHVLVGDRAAGVLARARTALDAGDLAGAVAAVSSLSGPPADAMAAWLSDAKAVLDARAGLADMAAHP